MRREAIVSSSWPGTLDHRSGSQGCSCSGVVECCLVVVLVMAMLVLLLAS